MWGCAWDWGKFVHRIYPELTAATTLLSPSQHSQTQDSALKVLRDAAEQFLSSHLLTFYAAEEFVSYPILRLRPWCWCRSVRKSGNLYNPAIQCRSPEVWRFQTSIEISEGLGSFNRMSPSNMCYVINFVLSNSENWKACHGFLTWEQIELTKSICIKFSVSPWSISFQHLLRPCPQCDRSSSCPGLASCRHVSIVSNVWQFGNLLRLRH